MSSDKMQVGKTAPDDVGSDSSELSEESNNIIPPKPTRPLTAYHIFFQLERNYIIQQSKKQGTPEDFPEGIDQNAAERPEKYRNIIMPRGWFNSGKGEAAKKKKAAKKIHGVISFLDLSKTISNRWNSADFETRMYCRDLANKQLVIYRKNMEAFVKKYGKDAAKAPKKEQKDLPVIKEEDNPKDIIDDPIHREAQMIAYDDLSRTARTHSNEIGSSAYYTPMQLQQQQQMVHPVSSLVPSAFLQNPSMSRNMARGAAWDTMAFQPDAIIESASNEDQRLLRNSNEVDTTQSMYATLPSHSHFYPSFPVTNTSSQVTMQGHSAKERYPLDKEVGEFLSRVTMDNYGESSSSKSSGCTTLPSLSSAKTTSASTPAPKDDVVPIHTYSYDTVGSFLRNSDSEEEEFE